MQAEVEEAVQEQRNAEEKAKKSITDVNIHPDTAFHILLLLNEPWSYIFSHVVVRRQRWRKNLRKSKIYLHTWRE